MSLHILYLRQYFSPPGGSGSRRPFEMAKQWVDAGHRVTMVTSASRVPDQYLTEGKTFSVDGIDVHALDIAYSNEFGFWRRVYSFLHFALRAGRVAKRIRNVDVVFASSTPLTIAIPALSAIGHHQCPLVFEVRDLWPEMPIAVGALKNPVLKAAARLLERRAYHGSSRVIALSPGMKEGVAATGYPEDRITVAPNICDLDAFANASGESAQFLEQHPELHGRRLVVYLGTVGWINRIEYLAEIASEMAHSDPSIAFVVVGGGRMSEFVRDKAENLGVLGRNFFMIPPVPREALPGVLGSADLAVSLVRGLPELEKNSANKFFDALASGTPIAINHGGWQAEMIQRESAGLVLPGDDAGPAARAIFEFLQDSEGLRDAGSNALALGAREFDSKVVFDSVLAEVTSAVTEAKQGSTR